MMFTEIIMKNMLKIESLIHVYVLSAETTILLFLGVISVIDISVSELSENIIFLLSAV